MSELAIAPPRERNPLLAVTIALLVLIAVGAAVFLFNPRKTAELHVTNVQVFAPRTEFKQSTGTSGMHVIGQPGMTEEDLYVVATVRIEDKLRLPLFLNGAEITLTDKDGAATEATAAGQTDVKRLQTIFPAIMAMTPHPLAIDDEISPGSSTEGQVVVQFPGANAQTWQNKKSAVLKLDLRNQAPQTIAVP